MFVFSDYQPLFCYWISKWSVFYSLLFVIFYRLGVFIFSFYHFVSFKLVALFAFSSSLRLILCNAPFPSTFSFLIELPRPPFANTQFAQHCKRHLDTVRHGGSTIKPLHSVTHPVLISSLTSSPTSNVAHVSFTASFPDSHTFRCHQFTYF